MPHFRWCARTDDMSSAGDAGHDSHHAGTSVETNKRPTPFLSCPADLDGLLATIAASAHTATMRCAARAAVTLHRFLDLRQWSL